MSKYYDAGCVFWWFMTILWVASDAFIGNVDPIHYYSSSILAIGFSILSNLENKK